MTAKDRPRPTDNAFTGDLKGGSHEPTYGGALSFMRRRYSRELAGADCVVWGVPFDTATSNRPGARFGPQAIRRASAIFDGDPQYPFGIDIFSALHVIDYGDCALDYGLQADAPSQMQAQAGDILASGAQLVSLGGDHFITYPLLKAHAQRHGPLALVQFDAHQDTWNDDGGRIDHGTMITRAVRDGLIDVDRSIQIGIRSHAPQDLGIAMLYAHQVHDMGVAAVTKCIMERVRGASAYLTFDIDCLDPAFAPGTGTPVAGGLTSAQALSILRGLGAVDFKGMDVVEVAPAYDHADITAIAGATVAMYYLGLLAEKRQG